MSAPKASVIISTYNQPEWLKKVLWSYEVQTETNFEVIIADDGSSRSTKKIINDFISKSKLKIHHEWQIDDGFQKTRILNKAILKSSSDYLIFTDGDCLARKDFVETHLTLMKPNVFLSGGYFKLPKSISEKISKEDILSQDCFNSNWLIKNGVEKSFKMNKLMSNPFKAWFLNRFTPTKATFDGMNVSGWKDAILKVNGFDERMQYGGEDRELGERLMYLGVKFKQIRYSAICLHLYHDRPYKNDIAFQKNILIRKETKKNRAVFTNYGLSKKNNLNG